MMIHKTSISLFERLTDFHILSRHSNQGLDKLQYGKTHPSCGIIAPLVVTAPTAPQIKGKLERLDKSTLLFQTDDKDHIRLNTTPDCTASSRGLEVNWQKVSPREIAPADAEVSKRSKADCPLMF
jgi:hypothetical protein